MTAIITNDGRDWISELMMDQASTSELYYVEVGTGTTRPEPDQQSLYQPVYRTNTDNNNCSIDLSSNVGEIDVTISLSGGTEVDGGTTISEIGVFNANENLIYHEVRDGIDIDSGVTIALGFPIDVVNT